MRNATKWKRLGRARQVRGSLMEQLEERILLADAQNVFATFNGSIANPNGTQTIAIALSSANFTLGTSKVSLGFELESSGSSLEPTAVQIQDSNGNTVKPLYTNSNLDQNTASLSVAQLTMGSYTITAGAQAGTSGAFHLAVFLAGDVNGSRKVDTTDLSLIKAIYGSHSGDGKYVVEADSNLDGAINSFDLSQVASNQGDSTSLNPLTLSTGLSPAPLQLSNGTLVTNQSSLTASGTTEPGATVSLGSGGVFDDGSTTANSSGQYSLTVPLISGVNSYQIQATDSFGQQSTSSFQVSLDDQAPVVTIKQPTANEATNTNPTINGTVTDDLSGVASLSAQIDLGTPIPVSFDASGDFSLATALALDGTADGSHTVQFIATDLVGNVSQPFAVSFILDTQAPTVTIQTPAQGFLTNGNVTVTGQASDSLSGVASLAAQVDGGAFVPISIDSSGDFSFTTALALDGSADGPHTVNLVATDAAGNTSTVTSLSFKLDTIPPAQPTAMLASADRENGALLATTNSEVTLVGQTDPNITVTLVGTGLMAQSTNTGAFQFPGLQLSLGDNAVTVMATDGAGNTSQNSVTIERDAASSGVNQVIYWNEVQLQAIENDASTPEYASRGLAMVSAAVYDSVNAIDGTPGYYVTLSAPADASADAAVSAAAYTVLAYLYPAQVTNFNSLLATDMASIPDGQSKTDGMSVGQSVANAIIAMRANDGSTTYVDYTPGSAPGDWQPTAPGYMPAENPQWATLKPFAMTSDTQFQVPAPPDMTSQEYADDVNYTLDIGEVDSTTRTADETEIAKFWNDKAGTYTPPGHWNAIAEEVAQQQDDSLSQDARLFAELNIAEGDAAIVAWSAKYTYNTWRPITLADGAGTAVNSDIETIANWVPLLTTPPFPEYVSGHSTFSAAAAAVLTATFGDSYSFTATSVGLPGVTRSYTSFEEAADEAGISRIYGGIHFLFSDTEALTAGAELGAYVLQTFSTSSDHTPPTITLTSPSTGSVNTSSNITITGTVLDNLSGVASLEAQIDGGAFAAVSFDAQGNFSLTTTFATDGTADGAHTINFEATDVAGNVTPLVPVTMTLDTQAPTITLSSPLAGTLTDGELLTGTADGTGSAITALSYNFDGGTEIPLTFGSDGSFSQALDQSSLTVGDHTLTVTARDAAGNVTQDTVDLNLAAPPALTLSNVAPSAGAVDIGVTFRPKINFSRPIDTSTLTASDFYLTDTSGNVIPTTIVPSTDGTYAWLFPTNPMPGASVITLNVDGSKIKASDGTLLDAAGTGTPGSLLTETFTTVSTANLTGTSLSGIVADPGPDLIPGTTDDVKPGPDGILDTGDDIYLHPIAGVTVYIIGQEDEAVTTGADGSFSFASVPSGDVKLVVDGLTATNLPAGYYFPTMTLDLTIQAGQANTVMGSMGTAAEQAADATDRGVYLPRVANAILQTVSGTQATTLTVPPVAAADLTPQQQSELTLTIQPGSLIGADGQPMTSAQIGISTVPPQIVMDMLPAGVMQHTFDITIQAMGVTTFSTPATLTFPNVFNAAPGTQLDVLSFDHTTGRLVIDGTATVSADGLTVTTDPGSGVTAPGWHGLTPPGSPPITPPPPCPPTPAVPTSPPPTPTIDVLPLLSGDTPTPDDLNDFSVPAPDEGYVTTVTVTVDSQLQKVFQDNTGLFGSIGNFFTSTISVPVSGGGPWTLNSDSGPVTFDWGGISDANLKANGLLNNFSIYGGVVTVDVVTQMSDMDSPDGECPPPSTPPVEAIYKFFIYRYLNPVYATENVWQNLFSATSTEFGTVDADELPFPDAVESGLAPGEFGPPLPGSSTQTQTLTMNVSSEAAVTPVVLDGEAFSGSTTITFSPPSDEEYDDTLELRPDVDLDLEGTGTARQVIYVDESDLNDTLQDILNHTGPAAAYTYTLSATEMSELSDANRSATVAAIFNQVQYYYQTAVGAAVDVEPGSGDDGTQAEYDDLKPDPTDPNQTQGGNAGQDYGYGSGRDDLDAIQKLVANYNSLGATVEDYLLPQAINPDREGYFSVFLLNCFVGGDATTEEEFTATTIAHEAGHTLGLVHLSGGNPYNIETVPPGQLADIMAYNYGSAPQQTSNGFVVSLNALELGLDQSVTDAAVQDAMKYYQKSIATGGAGASYGNQGQSDDGSPIPIPGKSLVVSDATTGNLMSTVDFGNQTLVGTSAVENLVITNLGTEDAVTITGATLSGNSDFSLVLPNGFAGELAPGASVQFSIQYSPHLGPAQGTVTILSDASPLTLTLTGQGTVAGPGAQVDVSNNNLGGAVIGQSVTNANAIVINNFGSSPLTISGLSFVYGSTSFSVNGLPSDLAANPITISPNSSYSLSVTYTASQAAIERGLIQLTTNDPLNPTIRAGVVGTGAYYDSVGYWGDDYVAISFPKLGDNATIRLMSNSAGNFSAFLPASTPYQISVFDPRSGLIAHGQGMTAASGKSTNLTSTLTFKASTAPDSNSDGLPDDIKFAIGLSMTKSDSNGDGIDDFTSLQDGINPLAGVAFPTGDIASLQLQGQAQGIAIAGSISSQNGQTAYVATGSYGLAIVNASQFNKPVVQGQIALSGTSTDVAIDTTDNLAILASGPGGVNIVNVADPTNPVLTQDVKLPAGAQDLLFFDGLAYVASGPSVVSIDPLTGEIEQTLDLEGGQLTGLAREGSFVYTMDDRNTLRVVDVSGFVMAARGSVSVTPGATLAAGSGSLFVNDGIAYIGVTTYDSRASNGYITLASGYTTVDVSDPDNPVATGGLPTASAAGQAISVNGSGIAVTVGKDANGPAVSVFDSSDPTDVTQFLTRFGLPSPALDVVIASGIAYVADGSGGLQVVNYESFDSKGVPPTVSISSPVADADPNTDGIQVVEGGDVPVVVDASDDVQVRNVELLVNGQVVANDVSLPYNLDVVVPTIASAGTTLTVQVEAFDTGGNSTLSNTLTFDVIPDTIPPSLVSSTPSAGADIYYTQSIDLNFSKPLDPSVLNISGVSLLFLGVGGEPGNGNGVPTTISSVELRTLDHTLSVYPASVLDTGNYELILDPSIIADRVGNHPTDSITLVFTIRGASDIQPLSGFPAINRAPAANVGQEIALDVPNATSSTLVTFPTIDPYGDLGTVNVAPTSIDQTTDTAYYIVPNNATTGNLTINITDDDFPLYLQIVPTLTGLTNTSSGYQNQYMTIEGSGFVDDATTINFGAVSLSGNGPYVSYDYVDGTYLINGEINLTVPAGADFGPITITTAGGTSSPYPAMFTGITGTAASGTPSDPTQASANPGQAITLSGSGFNMSTSVVFSAIDINGNFYQDLVKPIAVSPDGTQLIVVVPNDATTGIVGVVGDEMDTKALLQVVPVVTSADFQSVSGDGSSAAALIHGRGFVEGAAIYTFGDTAVADTSDNSGPDVYYDYYNNYLVNGLVSLTVPLTSDPYGAVTVTTAGGTSAPYTTSLTGIDSTAASGTPTDPSQASANPGQVVTITGSGLTTGTGVVAQYVDYNGNPAFELLHPFYTDAAGDRAEITIPNYYNGAFALNIVGSASAPLLQIVPEVTAAYMTGTGQAQLQGFGFEEGNGSTYTFDGASVVDTDPSSGPDVVYNYANGTYISNALVNLDPPTSGAGLLTVTTAGGTSAPFVWNAIDPNLGVLSDVASDPTSGALYVAEYYGNVIQQIDPTSGDAIGSALAIPGGASYGLTGLQVLPSSIILAGVSVPAGSLLVTNGYTNPDSVYAIDPSSGAVLATLILNDNLDANAGVFDVASGLLYLLRGSADQVAVVDPNSGLTISQFATPINVDYWNGGLALDPVTDDLWLGSAASTVVYEVKEDGTVVQSVDLSPQGVSGIGGLAFNTAGQLLVASTDGVVYVVSALPVSAPPAPTLTGITASVDSGTPTDSTLASANVAETIELIGTGFTASTAVVFPTRDNYGNVGAVTVYPTAVNAAGTQMQVVVPDLAETGAIALAGGPGSVFLQVVPTLTGISGLPGTDNAFTLYGSGFMDADTTLTVGGLTRVDQYTNQGDPTVSGTRNDTLSGIVWPTAIESTIRVATAGGWAQIAIPAPAPPPFVEFDSLTTAASAGTPANSAVASAVVGQSITLVGRGFNDSTIVQFTAEDQTGSIGVLSRTGTASADGTTLTVVVPAQAVTGLLHVVGASGSFTLQIVPTLRSVGGTITPGGSIILEGTGLDADQIQVSVGGQAVTLATGAEHDLFTDGLSQQAVDLVVPQGIANGLITVTTPGGSFTIQPARTVTALPPLTPATDPGDTLATALALGLTENSSVAVSQKIGDGPNGTNDVDLYSFAGSAGDLVTVDLGSTDSSPYPITRLFDATGNQLAIGYYYEEPAIAYFVLPSTGIFYVGISGYYNTSYNPTVANSGTGGYYTGNYTMKVTLAAGDSSSLTGIDTAAAITAQTPFTPSSDPGDTLTTATALALPEDSSLAVYQQIGDGPDGDNDVDLYSFTGAAGNLLTVSVPDSAPYPYVRLFDAAGNQLASAYYYQQPAIGGFVLPTTGTFYIGVSGYGVTSYNPTTANSGYGGYYTGAYTLKVTLQQLTGVAMVAGGGTPARLAVASANPGQTITLTGSGFPSNDQVDFEYVDPYSGIVGWTAVSPISIASDGSSLEVVVPDSAVSGTVRLSSEQVGLFLQVVPTVSNVDEYNSAYHGNNLALEGTGFIEGGVTINFGDQSLSDDGPYSGPYISYDYYSTYEADGLINLTVPYGVPYGPISVTTFGGTSNAYASTFTGIEGTAASGTPADSAQASANPEQAITLDGSGFTLNTAVVFQAIDYNGNQYEHIVKPIAIAPDGTQLIVVVPDDAITGTVSVVGDELNTAVYLQVVPVVSYADFSSISSDGTSAAAIIRGLGFIEGAGTYTFGTTSVVDTSVSSGPDVDYDYYGNYRDNGLVNLTVPLTGSPYGAVTVTTAGGTSAPYTVGLTGIDSTAASGTPADPSQASANPGQVVTITGSGLTTGTGVVAQYVDTDGNPAFELLHPFYTDAAGDRAEITIPNYYNGAFALNIVGSTSAPLLQIVPQVISATMTGTGQAQLQGYGFEEGNGSTYNFDGATVVDTSPFGGPDVAYGYIDFNYVPNGQVNLAPPTSGAGLLTVTTSGGTSAPFVWNVIDPNLGDLSDVASDPTSGALYVAEYNGNVIQQIDPTTGAAIGSALAIPGANSYGLTGLQVLPEAVELAGVSVPAGSLLVTNGYDYPDRVYAIDPSNGSLLATLALNDNLDANAGVFDAASGLLYLLRGGANEVAVVDPNSGLTLFQFATPINIDYWNGGLALDPVTDDLWLGSAASTVAYEVKDDGTVVRSIDLSLQGVSGIGGLAFNTAGQLLVASTNGVVYTVSPTAPLPAVTTPTLTAIDASADSGTPTDSTQPAANVAQTITLVGTNFTSTTQVYFPTLDNNGNVGTEIVYPTAVSADGTQIQVVVPDLATTGAIMVNAVSQTNFGFQGWNDSIYRNITLPFTASGSTMGIRFADNGSLQGLNDESWGIDNVRVYDTDTNTLVYSTDFESGAGPEWSTSQTDDSYPATFTEFLGRFSSGQAILTLPSTPGTSYSVEFDFYAIDSWDGNDPDYGPDAFTVAVDGNTIFNQTFNNVGGLQSYHNGVGSVFLQVVPTLTGISGLPGTDNAFTLYGSGFMDGATTLTVGGLTRVDQFTNQGDPSVSGSRNDSLSGIVWPTAIESTIRVATAGGWAQIAIPAPAPPPFVEFDSLTTTATAGMPANTAVASAVVGQSITLVGRGFNDSTIVQFTAEDQTSSIGVLSRTGIASADGTTLTVVVPAQAVTGLLHVVGASGSFTLQIVPTLRSVGGTITPGDSIILEGTGLDADQLQVFVGGQAVTLATGAEHDLFTDGLSQQAVDVVVPQGIANGLITVTTPGGSFTIQPARTVTALPPLTPATDPGDTLATALALGLTENSSVAVSQKIGDGLDGVNDVDLYSFAGSAGDLVTVDLGSTDSSPYPIARLFDATGNQLAIGYYYEEPAIAYFVLPSTGTFYVGISGYYVSYNPTVANSGSGGYYTGNYTMTVTLAAGDSTSLTGIDTAAAITAQTPFTPSSDPGDTLTTATALALPEDSSLAVYQQIGDGPDGANDVDLYSVTGTVGDLLTVDMSMSTFTPYPYVRLFDANGNQLASGSANYYYQQPEVGAFVLPATGTFYIGVSGYGITSYDPTKANSASGGYYTGPYTMKVTLQQLTSVAMDAGSGTAARGAVASANPGQTIILTGSGIRSNNQVDFEYVDQNSGAVGWTSVNPTWVASDGSSLEVVVPDSAVSGAVRLSSDQVGLFLQIVPTISNVDENSSAYHGNGLTLQGTGFIEGGVTINFGDQSLTDDGPYTGPDVYYDYDDGYLPDASLNLTVPYGVPYGPISVTTFGGTSSPYGLTFTGIEGIAASGTPANSSAASANPGQTITLDGSGFTLSTSVVFSAIDYNGNQYEHIVQPSSVSPDGTQLTVVVPYDALTGPLTVVGDELNTAELLQIVPVISAAYMTGTGQAQLQGFGFIEGNGTIYSFNGAIVVDNDFSFGPDVSYNYANGSYVSNGLVNLLPPTSSNGALTVTTAGGTSAPFVWNVIDTNLGDLSDVASDPNSGALYVAEYNSNEIQQIDPSTGEAIGPPIEIPGTPAYGLTGLQILPAAMTLAGVSIPAGALLVTNGYYYPNYVYAIDPSTGVVLASLALQDDLQANAGLYDPTSGELFLLRGSADEVAVVDPNTGVTLSEFSTPAGVDFWNGGLALNPLTDELWLGSATSTVVYEVQEDGTVVQSDDLSTQGVSGIGGLAFNSAGQLLVASTNGVVYVTNVDTQMQLALPSPHSSTTDGPSQADGLTTQELTSAVESAIALWARSGISTAQVNELEHVVFQITDLPGAYLGLARPGTIYIDVNADGYGWFVGSSTSDSTAFGGKGPDDESIAGPSSPAWGHMDLLTVVAHELGHELGLGDDSGDDLMGAFLPSGTRRLPSSVVDDVSTPAPPSVALTAAPARLTAAAVDQLLASHVLSNVSDAENPVVPPEYIIAIIDGPTNHIGLPEQPSSKSHATVKLSRDMASDNGVVIQKRNIGLRIRVKRIVSNLLE